MQKSEIKEKKDGRTEVLNYIKKIFGMRVNHRN